VVAGHWPVPTLAYGPGDSALDHTPEERLDLAEYDRAVAVLTDALTRLALGSAAPRPAAP
jgi:LysW-gamma-L-lysine carboxypeptidase